MVIIINSISNENKQIICSCGLNINTFFVKTMQTCLSAGEMKTFEQFSSNFSPEYIGAFYKATHYVYFRRQSYTNNPQKSTQKQPKSRKGAVSSRRRKSDIAERDDAEEQADPNDEQEVIEATDDSNMNDICANDVLLKHVFEVTIYLNL